jgi:hypothetical protein
MAGAELGFRGERIHAARVSPEPALTA